jgi:hypothetical protein
MLALFDLDETLYMGDLVKVAREKLIQDGITLPPYTGADTVDFSFSNFPLVLRAKLLELFVDPQEAAINKTPVCGSYTLLYYLKNILKYKIGVVTARPKPIHEATNFCLWRDFNPIKFDHVIYVNNSKGHDSLSSKAEMLRKLQPNYYFDDHYDFCLEARTQTIANVYMISNSHTGWNISKRPEAIAKGIKVIKCITEFNVRNLSGI